MWIYFILGAAFFIIGIIINLSEKELKQTTKDARLFAFILACIFYTILIMKALPPEYDSKKYDFKQEVRQKVVDDRIVKSDTIYILKRK